MEFFYFLNFQHPNKKFTFEKQKDGKLIFLDILVSYADTLLLVFSIKLHNWYPNVTLDYLKLCCTMLMKLVVPEPFLTRKVKKQNVCE